MLEIRLEHPGVLFNLGEGKKNEEKEKHFEQEEQGTLL